MDDWTLSLLTNRDLLALMGKNCKGTQLLRTDKEVVWKNKDSVSGRLCVALFNTGDEDALLSVGFDELEEEYPAEEEKALYELWDKQELSTVSGRIEARVPAHGVKVYRVG